MKRIVSYSPGYLLPTDVEDFHQPIFIVVMVGNNKHIYKHCWVAASTEEPGFFLVPER